MTKEPDGFQQWHRAVGKLLTDVPELARLWGRLFPAQRFNSVPFVTLQKPLRACRAALVTTGGVHLTDQQPFDMQDSRGDPSFRAIPADAPPERMMITHDYYDHRDAERDLNILLPLQLMRELAARRVIAGLATAYSFMGHIEPPHVATLLQDTAPQVAGLLKQEEVDIALLTPA